MPQGVVPSRGITQFLLRTFRNRDYPSAVPEQRIAIALPRPSWVDFCLAVRRQLDTLPPVLAAEGRGPGPERRDEHGESR
jgi:hypothetical protein